jgi:hypothetical protein
MPLPPIRPRPRIYKRGWEDGDRDEFGGVPDSVAGSGSVARSREHVRNADAVTRRVWWGKRPSGARSLRAPLPLACGPRGAGPDRSRYLATWGARNVGFAGGTSGKRGLNAYFGLDAVTTRVGSAKEASFIGSNSGRRQSENEKIMLIYSRL